MSRFSARILRRNPLSAAIALLPLFLQGTAQAQATQETPLILNTVVISATRVEQNVDDVAATVTTISAETIERESPTDAKDLLRYETGVSVREQPNRSSAAMRNAGRGGNEGINIRGLEGNQVLLQVDGVRLPAYYDNGGGGPFVSGRADYIDVEAFKRVEILRGPSSTQYGSDGLSGAISFVTKDPADLLSPGKSVQGAVKVGYSSADSSRSLVPSVAFRNDVVQGLVLVSLRGGHELDNMGTNDAHDITRTTPNPSTNKSDYVLAKLIVTPSREHEFKFTVDNLKRHSDTDIYSFFGDPATVATLTGVNVSQDITRDLAKLDYKYTSADNPWFQNAIGSVYRQNSRNEQFGRETRSSGNTLRTRDNRYDNVVDGLNLQLETNFGESVAHRFVYGVDTSQTDVTTLAQGYNTLTTYVPNKPFPDTNYRLFGAFLQDEISVGSISIIPGLRYDSFNLKPQTDALYAVNNPVSPVELKGNETSPKLGAIWKLSPLTNIFAQYAHGFRAPLPEQVNGSTTNLAQGYTGLGNPNLKPEKSDSFELGIRGHSNTFRYSASIFDNRYKDFIETYVWVGGPASGSGTASNPTIFQSINLGSVKISGFELRGEWAFQRNWVVSGSFAHATGDSTSNGVSAPLDTIDPNKLVLGLIYAEKARFGGQLALTAVESKKRNPDPTTYTPKGYQVVDLSGWYQIDKSTSLNAGVFNLFNSKYFQWADVRNVAATSAAVDSYSQPGRNFNLSLKHLF